MCHEKPAPQKICPRAGIDLLSVRAPYDCRWQELTSEPFQAMSVSIELPLALRALEEILGDDASNARLRDVSAFTNANHLILNSRLHKCRDYGFGT
jgi:hypothetical protein